MKKTKKKTVHDELMENPEFRKLSAIDVLCGGAADLIALVVLEQNVSKADLARSLKKSRSWVTQLLSGDANLTIRTLAEILCHLNKEVSLQTRPLAIVSRAGGATKAHYGSDNVFSDLGFSNVEARHLQLRSWMMLALRKYIQGENLTQAEAAKRLSVTPPRISDLMRGKINRFSLDTLVAMLSGAGLEVDPCVKSRSSRGRVYSGSRCRRWCASGTHFQALAWGSVSARLKSRAGLSPA